MKIILATSSPYRRQTFKFLGFPFVWQDSKVDEQNIDRPLMPDKLVLYLAKLKAEAVAKRYKQGVVIGFDSIGYFNHQILEKPKTRQEAFTRLQFLSGSKHDFYTSVYMLNISKDKIVSEVAKTEIHFRILTDLDIKKYLNHDPFFKTYALGYDALGSYGASFATKIVGSYNSYLRGIPLEIIPAMLQKVGYQSEKRSKI